MSARAEAPGGTLCIGLTPAVQRTLWVEALHPGEVRRARRARVTAAGKGVNVAIVLARLGAPARLVAFRGGAGGAQLAELLADLPITADWIETPAPTRTCVTVIEASGRTTELVEEAALPPPESWAALARAVDRGLAGGAALAVSGALMPGADPGLYAGWIARAAERGCATLIDSQGEPLRRALSARPRLVKCNAGELAATLGRVLEGEADLVAAMQALRAEGAGGVVVTRGPEPALYAGAEGVWRCAVPAVQAVNPIGAGDAVSGGILEVWSRGGGGLDAIRRGLACGVARTMTDHVRDLTPAAVDTYEKRMVVERLGAA
jgi:1-phosphofructokinase family hexose kinase